MKKQIFHFLPLLCLFVFASGIRANAGFFLKRQNTAPIATATKSVPARIADRMAISASPVTFESSALPKKNSKSGALAYLSAGCGILGMAVGSPATILIMMLLGLAAGVFGTVGLKIYKRKPFLRVLCYTGIILGAILVLFATIPILFLV